MDSSASITPEFVSLSEERQQQLWVGFSGLIYKELSRGYAWGVASAGATQAQDQDRKAAEKPVTDWVIHTRTAERASRVASNFLHRFHLTGSTITLSSIRKIIKGHGDTLNILGRLVHDSLIVGNIYFSVFIYLLCCLLLGWPVHQLDLVLWYHLIKFDKHNTVNWRVQGTLALRKALIDLSSSSSNSTYLHNLA